MATRLLLVRHGKALPFDPALFSDPSQVELSDEGIRQIKDLGSKLQQLSLTIGFAYYSPTARTQQTAELLGSLLGAVVPKAEPALGETFDDDIVLALIRPDVTTLMVGHEPTLAQFANRLLGQLAFPNGMAKGSAALLELQNEIGYGKAVLLKVVGMR